MEELSKLRIEDESDLEDSEAASSRSSIVGSVVMESAKSAQGGRANDGSTGPNKTGGVESGCLDYHHMLPRVQQSDLPFP